MQGKIIKGIAGFYYVYSKGATYECKAKGIFRKNKQKPLVGDDVKFDVLNEEDKIGSIEEILDRHSELIRPAVANVDQALVVFAIKEPDPNLNLLDRFLIVMKQQNVPTVICFNKSDVANDNDFIGYKKAYEEAGYQVLFVSAKEDEGLDEIRAVLKGKITTLAGPSGVGKSSLMNKLNPSANMDTGEISRKIMRGKHTTRHSELIPISDDTYLMDTPGFSNIYIDNIEAEELKDYYSEFEKFEPYCKFAGCNHIGEKECGVRDAVADGELSSNRYDNYKMFFEEIKDRRKY
ncbi:MAG: ribosome small subunit-dependent GTPase A [Lachnospiraceae bacterium]|jgi:ribosome biogenesis GTPase|nr:ribosome small subunit-dependent GTPase A [Lachnospiraceae bacterium]